MRFLEVDKKYRNIFILYLKIYGYFKSILDLFFLKITKDTNLDIIITTAEKDFDKIEKCVKSLRLYLLHNISSIFIVAPKKNKIIEISKKLKCTFVDENEIINKNELNFEYVVNNLNRFGWIYQQLLNFKSVLSLGNERYKLSFDSDTELLKKQKFIFGDKVQFNVSDEYHEPYFSVAKKILDLNVNTNFSMTSHHMIYDRLIMSEMLKKIETVTNKNWINGIISNSDLSNQSCHCEYETYGQYYYNHYRSQMKLEYWFNKTIFKDKEINFFEKIYYKSISNHEWAKKIN